METLSDHVPPPAPSGARASAPEQPRPSPEAAAEAPGEQGRGQQEEKGGEGRGHGSPRGPRTTAAFPLTGASYVVCDDVSLGKGKRKVTAVYLGLRAGAPLARGAGWAACSGRGRQDWGHQAPPQGVWCCSHAGCAPCALGGPGAAVSGGHSSTSGGTRCAPAGEGSWQGR